MHSLCHRKDLFLEKKRAKMIKYLRVLGKEHVSFHQYENDVLLSLYQIFTCEANAENKKYCLMQEGVDMHGILMIPDKHLLTDEENEIIYYTRMADELLRHRRVHLFMFYPEQYLNINTIEYQLNDDEFVVPKSILTPDYLKNLKRNPYGDYAKTIPYENANSSKVIRDPVNWIEQYDKANQS